MAIDITGANTYFGAAVHIRSESWTRIEKNRRIAAIATAIRLIQTHFSDDLDTDATVDGDFPRHDAAVYEQALWMLEQIDMNEKVRNFVLNSKQQGGTIASNVRALPESAEIETICLQARRYLYVNPRSVRFARG